MTIKHPIKPLIIGAASLLLAAQPFTIYANQLQPVTTHQQHAAHYYCPMHPEETSDKPGRCPICKMFLVKEEEEEQVVTDHSQHQLKTEKPAHDPITVKPAPLNSEGGIKYICYACSYHQR